MLELVLLCKNYKMQENEAKMPSWEGSLTRKSGAWCVVFPGHSHAFILLWLWHRLESSHSGTVDVSLALEDAPFFSSYFHVRSRVRKTFFHHLIFPLRFRPIFEELFRSHLASWRQNRIIRILSYFPRMSACLTVLEGAFRGKKKIQIPTNLWKCWGQFLAKWMDLILKFLRGRERKR